MKKLDLTFSVVLVPLDYLMILLAGISAYFLRYQKWIQEVRPIVFDLSFVEYFQYIWQIAILWLVIFALAGLYEIKVSRKYFGEFRKIFLATSTGILAVIVVMFFSRELFNSRFILLSAWGLSFFFVLIGRVLVNFVKNQFLQKGKGLHKIVVIGNNGNVQKITNEFTENRKLGFEVVGVFEDFGLENKNKIKDILNGEGIDELIQTENNLSEKEVLSLLAFTEEHNITFKYVADFFKTSSSNIEFQTVAGLPVVEIKKTKLDGWGKVFKRFFDIVFSVILIILFSPVYLILSLMVTFDSKGPIFYSAIRMGKRGKKIKIFKFRSMVVGADKMKKDLMEQNERKDGPLFKLENDPRATRTGPFLRKWSLDELPQFFNVLKGDLSLVGPRPHEPEEIDQYKSYQKKLLDIKPGVTGMAQVAGRSDLSFDDEVRLDVFYIENWNPWLDLVIMLKTPFVVLNKKGAK
jgi:exopolysaccharide biosynthesis polyprenyl glycosylphosphotransferase